MQLKKTVKTDRFKFIFFLVVMVAIGGILFSLKRIMVPLGIAYVLSLMLKPVLKSFYSADIGRKTMSILMVFGSFF